MAMDSPFFPRYATSGKNPMPLLITLLFVLLSFPAAAADRAVDLELVLAADISGSMDSQEAALQREGFVRALRHPEVLKAIQGGQLGRIAVTYVEWAGPHFQSTRVDWTEIADAKDAAAFASAVARPEISTAWYTSISTLITAAARSFEGNGFKGTRRIIAGDGPNNKGEMLPGARDRAVAEGIIINGLPIINNRLSPGGFPPLPNLDLYYEDCVIGGSSAFLVVANGFGDFARAILKKMVLEIAGHAPPPERLYRVTNRPRPGCDAGERQLEKWRPPWFYDN